MSNAAATKTSGASQAAKFAVVRLKPGDNLLELFQLLIHNGFGEVSFVNNLTETIFPAIGGGKRATSPSPAPTPKLDETPVANTVAADKPIPPAASGERMDTPRGVIEKARLPGTNSTDRFQLPASQASLQVRTVNADSRTCPPVEPVMAPKSTLDGVLTGDELSFIRAKRLALDPLLVSQTTTASASASASLPTFATMPSNFLGLPTMSSLNTAQSAAAAAAIAALSEAVTPPYSLANFFSPNNLPTTIPSATLIPPPTNGTVHQYTPALLAAAAAAQQRQAATVAASSTAPAIVQRPRSPSMQVLSSSVSQTSRPQLPTQPQQRIHMNQPSYQFQHNQFQLTSAQPRLAFPQPQPAKLMPQKSPPSASPGSSNSSTQSVHQNRVMDGMLSSNCAPMPPGCATTQLRQRGQRSYAEDPSLYVACRLCKNKIMGSRISNLTNHVRRHSSMKQFQCCYCDYTHNEMAKVRLHMLHNHKDKDSQPIDNLSPEMQASWDLLMKECFPDHCQQQSQQLSSSGSPSQPQTTTGLTSSSVASLISQHLQLQCQPPSASAVPHLRGEPTLQQIAYNPATQLHRRSESSSSGCSEAVSPHDDKNLDGNLQALVRQREAENLNNASPISSASTSSIIGVGEPISPEATTPPANQQLQPQQQFVARCVECGVYVNSKLKGRHIRKCHLQRLLPFVCSMCGYDHSEHSKVKVHICLKHDDDPMAQVVTRDVSTYAEQLAPQYFPAENEVQYSANVHPPVRDSSEPVAPSSTDSAYCITSQTASTEVSDSQRVKTESSTAYARTNVNRTRTLGQKKHAGRVSCGVCRRSIPVAKAVHHARKHVSASRVAFVCSICKGYKTTSQTRIQWHMESKHGVSRTVIKPLVFK